MCSLYVSLQYIFRLFGKRQNFGFLFFKERTIFLFWGQKKNKIRENRFAKRSFLRLLPLLDCVFLSKLYIPVAFKHFTFFCPKWRNMTSLKRHFLKNVLTDSPNILVGNVEFMTNRVMEVLRRYLLSFLSYRENTGEGVIFTPPPHSAVRDKALQSSRL